MVDNVEIRDWKAYATVLVAAGENAPRWRLSGRARHAGDPCCGRPTRAAMNSKPIDPDHRPC